MWLYIMAVNILAFSFMGIDKRRARAGLRRIPERSLFMTAIAGGVFGIWIGMYTFRHKTRKRAFVVGVPLLALLFLVIVLQM
ncbi:DUF1294 domain-containing protein [Ectobacillus funiculus]|uniref:DUF1294 domain-containing protein n=1 Tax=Ectobacillus funiculus TaxID=137993 RepID=UPI0039788EDA